MSLSRVRLDLITNILDAVSFVLVTPRLIGLDNLRRFNRSGFSFLSRTLFDNDRSPTIRTMAALTVGLVGGVALVTFVELPWIRHVDAAFAGAAFNATHALTPLNVTLSLVGIATYVVVPVTLLTGWLEVMMTRYDPEGAMLLAGGVLFAVARVLAILGSLQGGA